MIWKPFYLVFLRGKDFSLILGALRKVPVKKPGLGLLNIFVPTKEIYLSFQRRSAELIQGVTGVGAFTNADHILGLGEERRDRQKDWDDANKTKLKGLV